MNRGRQQMAKLKRNDPCPCGSGLKYKKCCLINESSTAAVGDFEWRKLKQQFNTLTEKLVQFGTDALYWEHVIEDAYWDAFPESIPEQADRESLMANFFPSWLLFYWIPSKNYGHNTFKPGKTIAENFLLLHPESLTQAEKASINLLGQSYYSFYTVLNVIPGKQLHLRDNLLGTTHIVKERAASTTLTRGDAIFSCILTQNRQSVLIGTAPFVIPSFYQAAFLELRKSMEESVSQALTPALLREEFDIELLDYFTDIMWKLHSPSLPKLHNTDGDPIQFSSARFKLSIAPEEALRQLLPLAGSDDPEEFLSNAKYDSQGQFQSVELPWLTPHKKQAKAENTVKGFILIEPDKLRLETNSLARAEEGKSLLEKYLGDAITYQTAVMQSPEKMFESLPKKDPQSMDDKALADSPEVQAALQSMAQKHWENWFDEPIPMLADQTPRQAAQTAEGRERLDALLIHYESADKNRKGNDPFKADIPFIRKTLALDE